METTNWKGLAAALMAAAAILVADDANPSLTTEQQEDFLRSGAVVSKKTLSMGVTASSKLTLDKDGVRRAAHLQTIDESRTIFRTDRVTELNFRDSYKFNIAAYELSKMLGLQDMVPASIERSIGGTTGAVTWWVEHAMTEKDRIQKNLQPPDNAEWQAQLNLMRAFDQLIYNTDRNLGNIMVTEDWHVRLIDHTRAFRTHQKCQNLRILRNVDERFLQSLRALGRDEVRARLKHYLTGNEIKALFARRDELVRYLEAKAAGTGAAPVLQARR